MPVLENWSGRQQAHSEACRKGGSSGSARLAAADERINRALADAVERHATNNPGMRGILKRDQCRLSSRVRVSEKLHWTQSRTRHHALQSHTEDHQHQVHNPGLTTSTDRNTGTSDATREVRTGPTQDVTRASSNDDIGDDVCDEGKTVQTKTGPKVRRGQTAGEESQRRGNHAKSEMSKSSTTEQHITRRVFGKTTPQECAVAVTTQEALDGSREKTMRIANVENITLNWVSICISRSTRHDAL